MTCANISVIGILAEDIISPFVTINNLTATTLTVTTLTVTTLNLPNPIKYLLYILIIHNHIGKITLQD